MKRREFVATIGGAMATLAWPASDALAGLCAPDTSAPLFQDGFDPDAFGGTPDYYLPEQPLFIHWDAPRLVHVGIDIDYPLTGYDWLNRPLSWHVLEGPPGMSIDAKGRLSWVPNTQGDVCVRIEMRAGADRVQSAFTIAVADARCVFVDGSAPAGGDGSLAAPFQTLLDALGTVQDGVGRTVYLRGGLDYRIENVSWYAMPSGNPYRRVAQGSWEEADPLLIRSFPGEAVRYTFVDGSGFVLGKRVVLIGVELVGGNAGEMAALLMNAGSVAKYVVARDYSCNAQNNCTGVKFHGGCLLDHVEAYDNFDRSNLTYHNSSNFLFYGTIGLPERADAFAIDCISSGFSVLGFKIKHAGSAGRMHLHRCVSYGTRNPFAGASNRSSVRHCLLYSDLGASTNGSYVLGLGCTDPSTGGEVNLDEGMLAEHNLVVGSDPDSEGLAQADYAFADGYVYPARYVANHVIVSVNAASGCGFTTFRYASLPSQWTATFRDNLFTTPNETGCIRTGSQLAAGVEHLNAHYGDGNQHVAAVDPIQRTLAGHVWTYDPGTDQLLRDGIVVGG